MSHEHRNERGKPELKFYEILEPTEEISLGAAQNYEVHLEQRCMHCIPYN